MIKVYYEAKEERWVAYLMANRDVFTRGKTAYEAVYYLVNRLGILVADISFEKVEK